MSTLKNLIKKFRKDDDGATAVEYGLLAGLIAVAIVLVVAATGEKLGETFDSVQKEVGKAPAAQVQPT